MSWYTMGRRTASGESVAPAKHNCAGAARFPLRSHVMVRNPANGRVVRVWINDRGAFEPMGRSLDCMPSVWEALGFSLGAGVVSVEVAA
jgi:rare lipoprotein A (peptidoglycan hydrolase)